MGLRSYGVQMTDTTPIACTLTTKDAESQALEWRSLSENALSTELLDGGVAMAFSLDMYGSVTELARREAECCSFLQIAVTRSKGETRLEITSDDPDAAPIIAAFAAAIT